MTAYQLGRRRCHSWFGVLLRAPRVWGGGNASRAVVQRLAAAAAKKWADNFTIGRLAMPCGGWWLLQLLMMLVYKYYDLGETKVHALRGVNVQIGAR